MSTVRLERLLEKRAQIENRIEQIKARERTQERKRDTRRKILIGGTILAMVKRGEWTEKKLNELLDRELAAQRDRELFGLAVRPEGSS